MCVAMAALDAVVRVQGPKGEREIPFAEFHRLPGDHPEHDTNLPPMNSSLPSICPTSRGRKIRIT